MSSKLRNKTQGFTIIEVLIVLAIAGLIMLIVFLAVPALQRNSRNTQRRSDVANYAGAVNEFIINNNGAAPATNANVTTINGLAKLSILTKPATVVIGARTNAGNPVTTARMELVTNARCDTTNIGETLAGSSTKQFAIRFATESSTGAAVPQCQEG